MNYVPVQIFAVMKAEPRRLISRKFTANLELLIVLFHTIAKGI